MSYTSYDLSESLDRAGIARESIERVIAAWGESPEGCGSWEGGFLLGMKDGRIAYLTGWADTSGWGCQDAAAVQYFTASDLPSRQRLVGPYGDGEVNARDWDEAPADLNRFLTESDE